MSGPVFAASSHAGISAHGARNQSAAGRGHPRSALLPTLFALGQLAAAPAALADADTCGTAETRDLLIGSIAVGLAEAGHLDAADLRSHFAGVNVTLLNVRATDTAQVGLHTCSADVRVTVPPDLYRLSQPVAVHASRSAIDSLASNYLAFAAIGSGHPGDDANAMRLAMVGVGEMPSATLEAGISYQSDASADGKHTVTVTGGIAPLLDPVFAQKLWDENPALARAVSAEAVRAFRPVAVFGAGQD